jgi:hypothetical protein
MGVVGWGMAEEIESIDTGAEVAAGVQPAAAALAAAVPSFSF